MEKKSIKSSVLKNGKRTFFFDIYQASNNRKYLKITESRFISESEGYKTNSVILFENNVQNFQSRLNEMIGFLSQVAV